MSLALLLSGDRSGCFIACPSQAILSHSLCELFQDQALGMRVLFFRAAPRQDHPSPLLQLSAVSSCTTQDLWAHCKETFLGNAVPSLCKTSNVFLVVIYLTSY